MNDKTIETLLLEIENFLHEEKLSKRQMAQKISIPYNTFQKWF